MISETIICVVSAAIIIGCTGIVLEIKDSTSVRILVGILSAILVDLHKRVVNITSVIYIIVSEFANIKSKTFIGNAAEVGVVLAEISLVNDGLTGHLS